MATNKNFVVKNGLEVGGDIVVTGSLQTSGLTLPASDGTSGQVIATDGNGNLSFQTIVSNFTISDGTNTDTFNTGETLTFTAGTGITTTVSNNVVTISGATQYTDADAISAVEGAAHLTIDGGTLYVDTSNNYVGIGDTSPQHKLDVAGGIGINGTEVIDTSGEIVTAQLKNSGVTAGSYGSASLVPVITVDAKGRITSASTTSVAGVSTFTYNSSTNTLNISTADGGSFDADISAIGGSIQGTLADTKVQYGVNYSGTPQQGSFFFDSLNQKLKVYTGSTFVDAVPAGTGGGGGDLTDAVATFEKFQYTTSSVTNAVSGSDDNGNTLSYVVDGSQNIEVYVNGIKQFEGASNDYVATTGSSVTFTYNLPSGSVIDIQVYELLTQDSFYLKSETYTKTETNTQISTAVGAYLPLTGGTVSGNVNFADNGKAIFGAGSDLQVWHNGTDSLIKETGAGDLKIQANKTVIQSASGLDSFLVVDPANGIQLSHNVSGTVGVKLATTSTGINVTGTVVADGLTIDTNTLFVNAATNNVGIGTSSPDASSGLTIFSTTYPSLYFDNNSATGGGAIRFHKQGVQQGLVAASGWILADTSNDISMLANTGNGLRFYTNGSTERMRIDSSGNVGIGVTEPQDKLHVSGNLRVGNGATGGSNLGMTAYANGTLIVRGTVTNNELMVIDNYNGSGFYQLDFRWNNAEVGSVSVTSSGATYNTTSDRRLKDNITTITDGKEKLLAMNPVTHTWKADPDAPAVHGFIAQEMQSIVPEAVSGDPESDEMMSMDYGRITPVIVAALQDALKEIEELKTRINELEAK